MRSKICLLLPASLLMIAVALASETFPGPPGPPGPPGQPGPASPAGQVNSVGVTLPPDAAPPSLQILRTFELNNRYMDRATSSYQKSFGFALTNEPLSRVDRNFNLVPAAATHWEVTEDGRTWVFHLRKDMVFGDGKPVTAYDYADTFRRWADPDIGFDFEWYYRSIKNWGAVVARKMPLDSLGVEALDPHTIAFTTTRPAPFAPHLLNYSWVTPTHQFEKYGAAWSTRPETHIGYGPYRLREWTINDRIVLEPNPVYPGPSTPYLERIIARLYNAAAQPPFLASYEAGEVDYVLLNNPAEINRVRSDPVLRRHLYTYTNFTTYYLFMDTRVPPFNDLRVRQAISHAIDQHAIMKSALKDIAVPAVSMMPAGFPAARPDLLAHIQRYDPERARGLLAEAGYPDGSGFPAMSLWLRGEAYLRKVAAEAIQAMLKQNLNINVEVLNVERKVYTEAMNAKEIPFSMIAYGWDYLTPATCSTCGCPAAAIRGATTVSRNSSNGPTTWWAIPAAGRNSTMKRKRPWSATWAACSSGTTWSTRCGGPMSAAKPWNRTNRATGPGAETRCLT